jgi:hypothetical protein
MGTSTDDDGTDLGRRIRDQREQAGLSRADAAAGAGMAPGYLAYLETSPAPEPSPGALARLAAALGTSTRDIAGAAADLPPGQQHQGRQPRLEVLSPAESREFLDPGGVGRFLFSEPRGPAAVPVNYRMLGGDIVFRTAADSSLAGAAGQQQVSFEVDHLDGALGEGWSVLVTGHARTLTDPGELAAARALRIEPWPGGTRDAYIRVTPSVITGRRIRAAG